MIGYSARHLALGVILAFVAGEHSLAVVALIVDVSAAAINAHCRHHQRVVAVYQARLNHHRTIAANMQLGEVEKHIYRHVIAITLHLGIVDKHIFQFNWRSGSKHNAHQCCQ